MSEDSDTKLNFVVDETIYIHGVFDDSISTDIIPQFKKLIKQQEKLKAGKITIDICSPGGLIYTLNELVALVEYAKTAGIIIETRSMSEAHSCGSILLMSGTKGHRIVSPLSQVLVHHATQGIVHNTDEQLKRHIHQAMHTNLMISKLIKKYAKIPKLELDKMLMDDGYYIFGEDLLKYGIADKFAYSI